MKDLVCVVPSRERPGNIARLLDAMDATCTATTKLIVGVDDDDPCLDEYQQLVEDASRFATLVVAGGMRRVVAWINFLAMGCADRFRYIGHFGDDNVPRTHGWDERVTASLRGNHFCFADDLYEGRPAGSLCCHIFMRSTVVRSLGYMGPPCFEHMYVDPVWMAWGEALGIEFLDDVILEHMHYSVGKASHDPSYGLSESFTAQDAAAFNAYCQRDLNADIERIKRRAPKFTADEIDNFRAFHNIPLT